MAVAGDERDAGPRAQRMRANLAAWQVATVFVALGLGFLFLSATLNDGGDPNSLEAVIRDLGSLLLVTGALSVLWDLVGRRALTDEVLDAADLSGQIRGAKLRQVAVRYLDVPWDTYLGTASHVDLFFAYGATWRATHDAALRRLVSRRGTTVRVVLPNPGNDGLVDRLAAKFQFTSEHLQERIQQAGTELAAIGDGVSSSSSFALRYTDEFPVFTYYRFDHAAITVMYAQAPGRTETPTLVFEQGGTLFDFFNEQFERLWENSASSAAGVTA